MESRGKDHTRLLAVATILLCLVFVLLITVYGTYSGGVDPFIIHAKSGGHHKHQSSINNQTSSSPSPSSPSSNQQSKVTNNVKNMNKQGTAGPLTTTTTAGSSSNLLLQLIHSADRKLIYLVHRFSMYLHQLLSYTRFCTSLQ
jgi:predicted PurR-regulated permease PerM